MEGSQENRQHVQVLIVDGSCMGSQLLADAVRRDHRLRVVKSTASCEEFLEAAASHRIDVALISTNLEENPTRGFQVLRELSAFRPEVRAVMLLGSSQREEVVQAFQAGARGVLSRSQSLKALSRCIRGVHAGQIWANSEELACVLEALTRSARLGFTNDGDLARLSKRHRDVVRCVAEGLTNREISQRLKLTEHTVKNYLAIIFERLGVSRRVELVFLARANSATQLSVGILDQGIFAGDAASALAWCRRAAEHGFPAAQFVLAKMYRDGQGVTQDKVFAYMWLRLAEKNAEVLAGCKVTRKQLAAQMTDEEITEAERRALEWAKQAKHRFEGLPWAVLGSSASARTPLARHEQADDIQNDFSASGNSVMSRARPLKPIHNVARTQSPRLGFDAHENGQIKHNVISRHLRELPRTMTTDTPGALPLAAAGDSEPKKH